MSQHPDSAGKAAPSLAELQRSFQGAVMKPRELPPDFIAETPGAPATERFRVYTEAYRLRLVEALSADYPALKVYLGEKAFDTLGRAYVDSAPSDQFSIRWFGRNLPRFLAETPPFDADPGLKDLARFEWALSEAFDAAGTPSLSFDDLAAIEPGRWPELRLGFQPALRRVNLEYNAAKVWQAWNEDVSLPALMPLELTGAWIVWRRELRLFYRSLPSAEAWAVDAFMEGRCFAEVCEGLCQWLDEDQVASSAAGFLQTWVTEQWIAGTI